MYVCMFVCVFAYIRNALKRIRMYVCIYVYMYVCSVKQNCILFYSLATPAKFEYVCMYVCVLAYIVNALKLIRMYVCICRLHPLL
jgi:hypothetical protein